MDAPTKKFVKEFLEIFADLHIDTVLEVGSKDVNGSVRNYFKDVRLYHGVDLEDGDSVDIVGHICSNGVKEKLEDNYDLVLCLSVLEHDRLWRSTLIECIKRTKIGGNLLIVQPSMISHNNLNFLMKEEWPWHVSRIFREEDGDHEGSEHVIEFLSEYKLDYMFRNPFKDKMLADINNSLAIGLPLGEKAKKWLQKFPGKKLKDDPTNKLFHSFPHSKSWIALSTGYIAHNVHYTKSGEYYGNVSLGNILEILAYANLLNTLEINCILSLDHGVHFCIDIKKMSEVSK